MNTQKIIEEINLMFVELEQDINYFENAHLTDSTITHETYATEIEQLKERRHILSDIYFIVDNYGGSRD